MAKAKKKKKVAVELTLWDVVLSYPDLHDPKPFKGKVYYKTDVLMDVDHSQLGELRAAIKKVRVESWGEDKSEWPEGAAKAFILNGDEREDQAGYKGKKYIKTSTQSLVPVIDLKGKTFPSQSVKGGMYANVAVRVSAWENEGDEGMSIYLQGVQIDTRKAGLNFGGGKSVKQMFGLEEGEEEESDTDEDDDQPRKAKKKTKPDPEEEEEGEESEDDLPPKKKKKPSKNFDEDDED